MIAPMLLQPIIENCFKYSRLETHPEGYVHISIQQIGSGFRFVAENTIARVFNSGLNFDNNPIYRERIEEHINHMPNVTSHFIDNLEKCYLSDFFSVFENVCATYNLTAKSRFTITPEENVKLFELLEAIKKHSKVNA